MPGRRTSTAGAWVQQRHAYSSEVLAPQMHWSGSSPWTWYTKCARPYGGAHRHEGPTSCCCCCCCCCGMPRCARSFSTRATTTAAAALLLPLLAQLAQRRLHLGVGQLHDLLRQLPIQQALVHQQPLTLQALQLPLLPLRLLLPVLRGFLLRGFLRVGSPAAGGPWTCGRRDGAGFCGTEGGAEPAGRAAGWVQ